MSTSTGGRKERPLKERFDNALSMIKSLPKEGPFQPSNTVKLRFYALYKQSTEGPCTLSKPSFWDAVGRAKWEAWTVCGKMSSKLAMQMYIEELKQMVETMPQTPESKAFLETIKQYPEDDDNTESATEGAGDDTDSGSGMGGEKEENGGKEGEEEEESLVTADDVVRDHPRGQKAANVDATPELVHPEETEAANHSGVTSDSDDFQDSFQVLPSPPKGSEQLQLPVERHRVSLNVPTDDQDRRGVPADNQDRSGVPTDGQDRRRVSTDDQDRSGVPTDDQDRSMVPIDQDRTGDAPMDDILPRLLSIQSNLHSILQQLTNLVSSVSSLPQLRPQPHTELQTLGVRRRRLIYRVVPFMLGWPLFVQFLLRSLIRRYGSPSSRSLPWWTFSLITFLHTSFTVALLTAVSTDR